MTISMKPERVVKLYERAGASTGEYRKTIITLSTGSLAAFFLALTTKIEPILTLFQKQTLFVALSGMGLSILLGIVAWAADARWAYASAAEIDPENEKDIEHWKKVWSFWYQIRTISDKLIPLTFMIGVIAALLYMWSRANMSK